MVFLGKQELPRLSKHNPGDEIKIFTPSEKDDRSVLTLTPGDHNVRGQDLVRDDIVWCWHCYGNISQVTPVGVQQSRAPHVLIPSHRTVIVPGLASGPGHHQVQQQDHGGGGDGGGGGGGDGYGGCDAVTTTLTVTLTRSQTLPVTSRPETGDRYSPLNTRIQNTIQYSTLVVVTTL